jgi:hypothetical protein
MARRNCFSLYLEPLANNGINHSSGPAFRLLSSADHRGGSVKGPAYCMGGGLSIGDSERNKFLSLVVCAALGPLGFPAKQPEEIPQGWKLVSFQRAGPAFLCR